MQWGTQAVVLGAGLALSAATNAVAGGITAVSAPTVETWIESFGSGSRNTSSCNTNQTCLTATGSGVGRASFRQQQGNGQITLNGWGRPPVEYNFSANLTIDSGHSTPNGFGGTCSAAGGTVTLTPADGRTGSLVLDVQGAECSVGSNEAEQVLTSTYVVDCAASSGVLSAEAGTGSFNMSGSPGGLSLSFSGSLQFGSICVAVHS